LAIAQDFGDAAGDDLLLLVCWSACYVGCGRDRDGAGLDGVLRVRCAMIEDFAGAGDAAVTDIE
jgi:hypothetical protein